jgi:hypothetical protein
VLSADALHVVGVCEVHLSADLLRFLGVADRLHGTVEKIIPKHWYKLQPLISSPRDAAGLVLPRNCLYKNAEADLTQWLQLLVT